MINELFDQYDSNIGMSVKADDEKTENQKKAEEILNKIKYIQTELENSTEMNINSLSAYINKLLTLRNINFEEFKNNNEEKNKNDNIDIKPENLSTILNSIENNPNSNITNPKIKENKEKNININSELIKMESNNDKTSLLLEAISKNMKFNQETESKKEKNEEEGKENNKLTGKKRTRERKKKDGDNKDIKQKDKIKEKDDKKKSKKKKINNKENENNNSNRNIKKDKDKEKEKDENIKKKKTTKDNKQNKTNNIQRISNESTDKPPRRASNSKTRKKKDNSEETKKNNKTPKKIEELKEKIEKKEKDNKKKVVKILEEIAKRQYEIGSNVKKKISDIKTDQSQNKEKEVNNINNNDINETNNNIENNKLRYQKYKKKGKKKYHILVIDEELKKSTPIRNLKKQPKSILKKINSNNTQPFIARSPSPKRTLKAKSSEKKINLSSEKNKKFKTFAEIFQSPSKLKATPLKRRVNSEKKSNIKINNILTAEEKTEKKDFIGKKRNISFNDERIVKEYNPKTPVRDVKQRVTRKSPLERKNRNELIN